MTTIKPTGDNIIIKIKNEKEMTTASGIYIAKANAQARPDRAEVVAIGEGRILNNGTLLEPKVKSGDQILFNRFAGTEIQVGGDDLYLIIKETDVMAIIIEE